MTTETTGECPSCKGITNTRYGNGWYSFDTCPNCGFGYGIDSSNEEVKAEDVFRSALDVATSSVALYAMSGLKRLLANNGKDVTAFKYDEIGKVFNNSKNDFYKKITVSGQISLISDKEISGVRVEISYLRDTLIYIVDENIVSYYFNGLRLNLDSAYESLSSFPETDNYMPVLFAVALSDVLEKMGCTIGMFDPSKRHEPIYEDHLRIISIYNKSVGVKYTLGEFFSDISDNEGKKMFNPNDICGLGEGISEKYRFNGSLFKISY